MKIKKPMTEELCKNYECYLGYACNRKCLFCFTDPEDRLNAKALSYGDITRNIYRHFLNGYRGLALLGGEPTVHKDIFKILSFAKKTGYNRIILFTNGLKLRDIKYVQKLKKNGVREVVLNIPSHKKDIFEFLTGAKGTFEAVLTAIDNLRENKIAITLIGVINKENYKELADYADFYIKRGIRLFTMQYMKFQGRVDSNLGFKNINVQKLKVSMSEASSYIKKMIELTVEKNSFPPFFEHMPPCVLTGYESRVLDFYADYEAERLKYKSIHPDGKNEFTFDVAYKDRIKLKVCANCVYEKQCPGIEKKLYKGFWRERI